MLPSPPTCGLSGSISTFSSCTLSGSTFSITIEDKYNYGSGSIVLTISEVSNPDEGTTEGFLISTTFDGLTLDETDETTLIGRTITTKAKASDITVSSISFDPQNISEQSTYTFKFITTDSITSSMSILF